MENNFVRMAKKGDVASFLNGGSLIGLNVIFPPFDQESVIYEFRIISS
jgi:hypothetical protein